jgi:hypothetical protein
MAVDKGLLFLTMVWSLTILVIALVGTIAFATAQWITAGEVESASFNLKEISLGMVHSCYTLISDDQTICGRYGEESARTHTSRFHARTHTRIHARTHTRR